MQERMLHRKCYNVAQVIMLAIKHKYLLNGNNILVGFELRFGMRISVCGIEKDCIRIECPPETIGLLLLLILRHLETQPKHHLSSMVPSLVNSC